MASETMMNLQLPLASDVFGLLQTEATQAGRPMISLASDVVTKWVRERHRQRVAHEIAEFAAAHAGSELDLDKDLEAATIEFLCKDEP